MKKTYHLFMRSRFLILSLAALLTTHLKAQVSAYTFLTSNGTYAPITGTDLFGAAWNDNVSAIPIGFNFTFNAASYSSVTVSSNGFVTFGATAPATTNYTPVSSTATYSGAISGFGKDLSNNGGTTSVSYTTTGVTPNQKCIIQWQNAKRVAGDVVNFQIILNETSNKIDVMYGTCTATSTANTNKVMVGLRGATNADFNNLSGGNNVAWTAFAAGTTNADNVNYKSTVVPASGLTFSWKITTCFPPTGLTVSGTTSSAATFSWTSAGTAFDLYYGPTPLTAPTASTVPTTSTSSTSYNATGLNSGTNYALYVRTNCGAGDLSLWTAVSTFSTITSCFPPTGIAVSGITSSTATFSWTSAGTAFDLYYGPTPFTAPTATTVPTASTSSTSYAATGLTSASPYKLYVRRNCGPGDISAWSAVINFTTACGVANVPYAQNFQSVTVPAIPLCTSVENAGTGNIWETANGGSSFTTKVLSYTYDGANQADTWYYLQALNLTGGTSYRLTYQYENSSGTTFPERMNVSYGTSPAAAAMTHTLTDHPNIVNTTANTQVVDFTPATTGVYYIGFHGYSMADEDELYVDNITVDLSPTCLDPSALNMTGLGTTTASASWTPAGVATAWDIYYGPTPLTPPTAATVPTATSSTASYTITGLTSGVNYNIYVRSHCSVTDQSNWTPVTSFLTPCTATVIPYSQDFQSVTVPALPVCTSVQNAGTGNAWKTVNNPGSGFTTKTLVYNYNTASSADTWYYVQGLSLTAGTSYRLTYKYGNNGSTTFPENLNVNYGSSPVAAAMTHTLTNHLNLTNSSPVAKTVDFTPAATGVYYIGFHAYSDPDQNQLYVDDITVDLSPSCIEPVSLTSGSVTPTTAVIGWTPTGTETAWDIFYGASPVTPPTAGTVPTATAATTSFTLTGLTPSMGYAFYVRAHCSVTDQSPWVGPSSLFTPCLPPNITSTTSATRCGIGTTTLGATADAGAILNWYTASTGGSPVATGSVFTTPTISVTTNYYLSTSGAAPNVIAGGLLAPVPSGTTSATPLYEGLFFDATQTFTLVSVDVYPDGPSDDVEVDLYDDQFNTIGTYIVTMPAGTGTTAVTVPINVVIPVGTGYNFAVSTNSGTNLIMNSGSLTYPYALGNVGAITSGTEDGFDPDAADYFYLYNIKIATVCEGPRVAVTATVTPPPALSLSSGTTTCANVISPLNVTSTLSDYSSYVWTPNTNLYTDAAATTPYTGGNATALYYKSVTDGTTRYAVTANNSSNCANIANVTMVTDVPVINTSATPSVACSGSTVALTAICIAPTTTVAPSGPTSGFDDYLGGPYRSGAGTDYKVQWLFTAAELTTAGFTPGNITSLAFNVTVLGGGVMPNYTIRMGTTASTGLTTTFDATPSTTVFGPVGYSAVAGMNTHTFSTPFFWDGVSNVVVQVCHDAVTVSSSEVDREAISNRTLYTGTAGACGVTAGTSEAYRPVIRFGGQARGNASATRNFVWNPGAVTTNTTVVTPVNTGSTATHPSYTVTVTNPATTCSNTAVVTLTVNPLPTVLASSSTPSVCSGTTASLTASGATTYSWMPAGGAATVAVVSPTAATIYTVTGTALGCRSTATVNLTVNATPTVVALASPSVICAGATLSLTASGALTYTWSPISVMSATATVTPTTNTTYSVTGSTSGCASTKTVNVIVNHVPTLTVSASSSALCTAGATATLTATGTSTAYVWSNGATTASTAVTPNVTTIYTLMGTNVCGTTTGSIAIGVGTVPTLTAATSAATICTGNAAVLTVSGTATSYSWSTGAVTMSITVTPTATTNYSVTGTSVCGTTTVTLVQNVALCTGIESIMNSGDISMYPNPAHDRVSISIGSYLAANNTTVEITDALGKLVMKENLNTDITTISLNNLQDGIYFFKVITNNQVVKIGKVVKQ